VVSIGVVVSIGAVGVVVSTAPGCLCKVYARAAISIIMMIIAAYKAYLWELLDIISPQRAGFHDT